MKRTIAAIVTVLVVCTASMALAQIDPGNFVVAKVCVDKQTGNVRSLSEPRSQCGESEAAADWTVGGEITAVDPGHGLKGGGEDGKVRLEVDNSVVQDRVTGKCEAGAISAIGQDGMVSCTDSGGEAIAGFNDGPGEIDPKATAGGSLDLPEGKYVVFAKMWVSAPFNNDTEVSCKLHTGVDFDNEEVFLSHRDDGPDPSTSMSFMVVHNFTQGGKVGLSCFDVDHLHDTTMLGSAVWHDVKIVAMKVSSVSNTFLGV